MGSEPSHAELAESGRTVGRYALFDEIASGGMATVHLGRLLGPVGFSRTVAIKRLHPQYAKDAEFVAMFLDEARLVARIRHPNVVPTLDVVQADDELLLVMEYVQGEALSKLVRRSGAVARPIPTPIVASILAGVLHGLHAAHDASGEKGEPLEIVHRDVSPQNVLVGVDGVSRLLDFGVAKATQRSQSTRDGQVKGKISYMAPEQLSSDAIDRRADIFSAGVVLWEALTNTRLFAGPSDARVMAKILAAEVRPPRESTPNVPPELDAICMRALSLSPADRFQTAREMALAIEHASLLAPASQVGGWVESLAHDAIEARAARVHDIESRSNVFARVDGTGLGPVSAAHDGRRKKKTTALIALGAIGAVAAALVAGFAIASARNSAGPAPSATARIEPTSSAAPAEHADLAATAPATTPAPTSPASAAAATTGPTTAKANAANAATVSATITDAAKPHHAAPAVRRNPCAEPFIVDATGIKHIKPECM